MKPDEYEHQKARCKRYAEIQDTLEAITHSLSSHNSPYLREASHTLARVSVRRVSDDADIQIVTTDALTVSETVAAISAALSAKERTLRSEMEAL
jgi:hypothetical protein